MPNMLSSRAKGIFEFDELNCADDCICLRHAEYFLLLRLNQLDHIVSPMNYVLWHCRAKATAANKDNQ